MRGFLRVAGLLGLVSCSNAGELADGVTQDSGPRTLLWDGRDAAGRPVPSGLYWVRLRAGNASPRVRLLVLR